jgi:hypothetical protein
MKYLILFLCLLPTFTYAGCEEMFQALTNIEQAIQEQSAMILATSRSTSPESQKARELARQTVEWLIPLRQTLLGVQCPEMKTSEAGREVAPLPPRPPKPESERKFRPAGRM